MKKRLLIPDNRKVTSIFYLSMILFFTWTMFSPITIWSQNSGDKTCVDCHKRTVKKDILHGPTATDCTICHIPNSQKHPLEDVEGFKFKHEGAALCYSCHEDASKKFTTDKYVHPPVKDGECLECHDVHSSDDPKLIFAKSPDLCYFCHDKLEKSVESAAVVHQPVNDEGGCTNCHSPHSSSQKRILRTNETDLCLSCHDKTIKKGEREIINIKKHISSSKFKHEALEDGCTECHNPHASQNSALLNVFYPTTNYAVGIEETYQLCFGCHDADLLLVEKTKYGTGFRDGTRNLHFVHVKKEKGRTCKNCHNIHGSSREHLIPETIKFGSWDMPLNYKAYEDGGSCSSGCHKEQRYTR